MQFSFRNEDEDVGEITEESLTVVAQDVKWLPRRWGQFFLLSRCSTRSRRLVFFVGAAHNRINTQQ